MLSKYILLNGYVTKEIYVLKYHSILYGCKAFCEALCVKLWNILLMHSNDWDGLFLDETKDCVQCYSKGY